MSILGLKTYILSTGKYMTQEGWNGHSQEPRGSNSGINVGGGLGTVEVNDILLNH